jgi:lipid A 4'-phosphatase
LLVLFPAIDIAVSKVFFDGSFYLKDRWWQKLLQGGLGIFIYSSIGAVVVMFAANRLFKRNVCCMDARRLLFVMLVLVVGAGLVVNVIFKDNFGRARPRDVAEFGGTKQFTPAFMLSHECNKNCSFSSGDAAGAFFSLALALALSRKRALFLAALAVGALVSLGRISAGAHFFSDTVVSFFVMLIVSDVLFFYVVLKRGEPAQEPVLATVPGLAPEFAPQVLREPA